MKNKDKYKDYIATFKGNLCASDTPWEVDVCRGEPCRGCILRFLKWMEKDYYSIISKVERDFLANVNDLYNYIGRDIAGDLWLFENAPHLNDGVFENNGGRIYKCPDFIAGEFNGIERETYYMIAQL